MNQANCLKIEVINSDYFVGVVAEGSYGFLAVWLWLECQSKLRAVLGKLLEVRSSKIVPWMIYFK